MNIKILPSKQMKITNSRGVEANIALPEVGRTFDLLAVWFPI